jgi:hypothetical protein
MQIVKIYRRGMVSKSPDEGAFEMLGTLYRRGIDSTLPAFQRQALSGHSSVAIALQVILLG